VGILTSVTFGMAARSAGGKDGYRLRVARQKTYYAEVAGNGEREATVGMEGVDVTRDIF
jgi:hypothetical protein